MAFPWRPGPRPIPLAIRAFRLTSILILVSLLFAPGSALANHTNPRLVGGPGKPAVRGSGTSAGPHLTYYGGPVISNARVVMVLWGTGTYAPEMAAGSLMESFYQTVVDSPWMDWLSEYNTPTQKIGRGTYAGRYVITPSTNASTIPDTTVQTELKAQIHAGNLPPADVNTVYMISFPSGKTITISGSTSCVQFCAYHGTTDDSGLHIKYGVLPYLGVGSPCAGGCGSAASLFDNQTSVASHELNECILDPDVGLATVVGFPLAWYDSTNGESADICNAQQATVSGYVVQKIWSNAFTGCVATRVNANDYSISVAPTLRNVNAGSSVTFNVTTTLTNGSVPAITLSATNLPTGVSAGFVPAAPAAGTPSVLTLTASSGAPVAATEVVVEGAAAAGPHTASGFLNVLPPPPTPTPTITPTPTFTPNVTSTFTKTPTLTPTPTRTPTRTPTHDPNAFSYNSVTPCRVFDTRDPVGAYGGPPLAANADRLFIITGKCGVPAGAKAVTINIAVTGSTGAGDLRLYGGGALPNVSAINYGAGQTRANNAVITLGSSGELVVHCDQASGTTNAILDVTGYFQ